MALPGWLLLAVGLLLAAVGSFQGGPVLGLTGRWIAIAGLFLHGLRRRSLTTWILVSMIVGAEIGHDWPDVAISLRVLSQIFLRMIKTIIAPLLFGTLVVGIAGHADLKQVGRMGLKALVYFEVVTTSRCSSASWPSTSPRRGWEWSPRRRWPRPM
jgi:proton glutamate symport protein